MKFTDDDAKDMLKKYNFYDARRNKNGSFKNNFKDNGNYTITDRATGLMWQKAGSPDMMPWSEVHEYIKKLNQKKYAGYSDWRLPSLEEVSSLIKPHKTNGVYIDPIFSEKQGICCTSDTCNYDNIIIPWFVSFLRGVINCNTYNVITIYCVKAVRSENKAGLLSRE
ncbi:hypothetical protein GMMP15_790006 [Candidatus Magnetomoraceae bacterium gMMP-15]